jgi:hypothetical protein
MCYRGWVPAYGNYNNFLTMGTYAFGPNGSATNSPGFDWGTLIVTEGAYIIQEAIGYNGANRKRRFFHDDVWEAWANF